jgi:hypothetical protein
MIELIHNIPVANTGYEDNSNNAIKYLESNKDKILDLAEKNYEKLVELLTNNTIDTVVTSSYVKLSL